ncbi:VOC family protein [Gracilimonas sp. Q87]|uniref:VOC family protein n=1 Tax=Gracilimonas sp. Q87 TaxID=3384766 RepID=UPI0039842959
MKTGNMAAPLNGDTPAILERRDIVWSIFDSETKYTDPSSKEFMVNYRIDDLEALLEILRKEGVEVIGEIEVFEYGKFGWIMGPDGVKIELWEPNDEEFDKIKGEINLSG